MDIQDQNVKIQLFEAKFNSYIIIKKIITGKYKAISSPMDMLNKLMSNPEYFEDTDINITRVKFLFSKECYNQLLCVTSIIKEYSKQQNEMKYVLELLETHDSDYYDEIALFVEKHQSDQLSEEQILDFKSISKTHEREFQLYPNNLVRYNFSNMFFKAEELKEEYVKEKEILYCIFEEELHL